MNKLVIEIPGKPLGKQRPRFMRNGHTYTPMETVNYENLIKVCFAEKYPRHTPIDGAVNMDVTAVFPIPDSWSKKKKAAALQKEIRPGKPDIDNIYKIVADALNGIAYKDDAQVAKAAIEKYYGEKPCLTVVLNELSEM